MQTERAISKEVSNKNKMIAGNKVNAWKGNCAKNIIRMKIDNINAKTVFLIKTSEIRILKQLLTLIIFRIFNIFF